jgi:Protein of unknown function (DUF551)
MSEWISINERLPELGDRIWARFSKKNGEARKVNPVVEGDFDKSKYGEGTIGFLFGVHRNINFPPDYCPEVRLTHWQPRLDGTPPSPHLPTLAIVSALKGEKPKRPYHLTPEGLAAKRKAVREYWRKRKGNAATTPAKAGKQE